MTPPSSSFRVHSILDHLVVHLHCVLVVLPRRALAKSLNGELLAWLVEREAEVVWEADTLHERGSCSASTYGCANRCQSSVVIPLIEPNNVQGSNALKRGNSLDGHRHSMGACNGTEHIQ
jgi:hypothetical protein